MPKLPFFRRSVPCALWLLSVAGAAVPVPSDSRAAAEPEPDLEVVTPEKSEKWTPRRPERSRWSWNSRPAEITPLGDLKWKPKPFTYEAGESVRFIDFDEGSDSNDGKTRTTAWKHHPWDPQAGDQAKAASRENHCFVFKRGVTYRGALVTKASGEPGRPIQLTSDPSWGSGEAVISGSRPVTEWSKGSDHPDIPDAAKVWTAEIDWLPRCVWMVDRGKVQRLNLARTPNWTESDPEDVMKEWWTWEQPEWWKGKLKIPHGERKAHLGIDTKNLTQNEAYYKDAVLRTEFAIVMGTPFPTRVEAVDTERKGLVFQGIWFNDSETIATGNRYFLEDKPHYLDAPGEFWFERKGNGGRLHVRLPADRSPKDVAIEAAHHINLIESDGLQHCHISGLTFRFSNIHWDLTQPPWGHKDVNNACVRILGDATDVSIHNCTFQHVGRAVRVDAGEKGNLGRVTVSDNAMEQLDHGAIEIDAHGKGEVLVMRNRLHTIGLRPYRQDHSHALQVRFPQLMEVAGNMLDRCYGAGLFLFGGKPSGADWDVPLARTLVYGNRVVDSLLSSNDWGGIETWQGGPAYVFNNISGNPNGYWNWSHKPGVGNARLGFAYYMDGAFKNYYFNNVAWGLTSDVTSPLCNASAFYEAVPTINNAIFNNTASRFADGSNWSPAGGRHLFLGNCWLDIGAWVFMHGKLKEDKGDAPPDYPYATMAYGANVFYKIGSKFGVFEADGSAHDTAESFQSALASRKPLASDLGVVAEDNPVRDLDKRDFRLVAGSAAIDRGVKTFVPWGLARTVGEWHFRRNNQDPTILFDDHWYMTPYYMARETYHKVPVFNLTAHHISADDYHAGPLEDWAPSALVLNGKDQFASLAHATMSQPISYKARRRDDESTLTAEGEAIANPDIHAGNFLVESYFRSAAGQTSAVLIAKMDPTAGYQLALNGIGGLTLSLRAGGATAACASGALVNDGAWHHALAEVDREAKTIRLFVDGKLAAETEIDLPQTASLSNGGDLLIGKGPRGHHFEGAFEYVRICRATLAEARTSIEELYDWQFDGPFLRDFTGHAATGERRDAGAFEFR